MADATLLALRLVHIFAGVFWAGTVFFLIRFLSPALDASGPAGGRVLKQLFMKQKIGIVIPVTAVLAVSSGIWMYMRNVRGSDGVWAHSRPGMVFGIGGAAALIALIAGASMIGPSLEKIVKLGDAIERDGRAPTADETATLLRLKARASLGTRIAAGMLAITVAAMAIGRYV
jgi:uncharacterized membrane protein